MDGESPVTLKEHWNRYLLQLDFAPDVVNIFFYNAGACAVCNLICTALQAEEANPGAFLSSLKKINEEINRCDRELRELTDKLSHAHKPKHMEIN